MLRTGSYLHLRERLLIPNRLEITGTKPQYYPLINGVLCNILFRNICRESRFTSIFADAPMHI